MQIKQMLIPTKYKKTRPGTKMTPKYITIHETANTSKGANAAAHARLQYNGNSRTASWHFTVDDHSIYQSLPTNEVGFHAGDGGGPGNRQSIGIEICVNSDGNFSKAKANAAELVRQLMDKHTIPISRVVQHNKWTGKNCPANLRKSGWSQFINQIKGTPSPAPTPQPYDNNAEYHRLLALETPYMHGEDIKRLQKRLQSKSIDGIFGPATEADVKSWQNVHDADGETVPAGKGLDVDGIVGPETWNALFPESTPTPTLKPPMRRVVVDGKEVVDSAYTSKLLTAVEKAIEDGAKEIVVKIR